MSSGFDRYIFLIGIIDEKKKETKINIFRPSNNLFFSSS